MNKMFRDEQNKSKFNRKERRELLKKYNKVMRRLYKLQKGNN